MKLGGWEIYVGFPYRRLPEDWDDFDVAMKKARPAWSGIGLHLWHDGTDEVYMFEIWLSRNYGARAHYSHFAPNWMVMKCDCDECRLRRRKLGLGRKGS